MRKGLHSTRTTGRKAACLAAALVAALAAALALPGAALALQPGVNNTGPGGGIWGVMQRHSDAKRVLRSAYSRIIRPTDPAAAISCFDRSLALSSRLGSLFSERPPTALMPATRAVFREGLDDIGKLRNNNAGLGVDSLGDPNTLGAAYAGSLMNVLDSYMGGPGGLNTTPAFGENAVEPSVTQAFEIDPAYTVDEVSPAFAGDPMRNFAGTLSDDLGMTTMDGLGKLSQATGVFMFSTFHSVMPTGATYTLFEDAFDYDSTDATPPASTQMNASFTAAIDTLAASVSHTPSYGDNPNVLVDDLPAYYGHMDNVMRQRCAVYRAINKRIGDPVPLPTASGDDAYNVCRKYAPPDDGNPLNDTEPEDGVAAAFARNYSSLGYGSAEPSFLGSAEASMTGIPWNDLYASHIATGTIPSDATGCSRIVKLWGGIPGNNVGATGLQGGGATPGMPYITYSDLVTATPATGEAGKEFFDAVVGSAPGVLAAAREDLKTLLRYPDGAPPPPAPAVPIVDPGNILPPTGTPLPALESWRATPPAAVLTPATVTAPNMPAYLVSQMP